MHRLHAYFALNRCRFVAVRHSSQKRLQGRLSRTRAPQNERHRPRHDVTCDVFENVNHARRFLRDELRPEANDLSETGGGFVRDSDQGFLVLYQTLVSRAVTGT